MVASLATTSTDPSRFKKGTATDENRNEASSSGIAENSALSQKHPVEIQAF
jgi:hypothetical protein